MTSGQVFPAAEEGKTSAVTSLIRVWSQHCCVNHLESYRAHTDVFLFLSTSSFKSSFTNLSDFVPFLNVCIPSQENEWCSWATTLGRIFSRRSSTALCPSLRSTSRICTPWTAGSSSTSTQLVCIYLIWRYRVMAASGWCRVTLYSFLCCARASRLRLSLAVGFDSGGGRLGCPGCTFPWSGSLRSQVWPRPPSHGRQAHPDGRSHQVRQQCSCWELVSQRPPGRSHPCVLS